MSAMLWEGGQDVLTGAHERRRTGRLRVLRHHGGQSGVATVSEVWGELQRAAGAAERLVELIDTSSLIDDPGDSPLHKRAKRSELRLEQVTFAYPTRPEQAALKDFSLAIAAGKSLALVGPSGAGKSTVFELLQRFYDPQQGRVLLDGMDIRELGLRQLREHIALVPQQPALFTGDVRYNIAYGKPDASDEEVYSAARAAHAHEFISAYPKATPVIWANRACACPAASASASPWPGPYSTTRRFCCWTRLPAPWTPRANTRYSWPCRS